jgi:hypothetical protein
LISFAADRQLSIAASYTESQSGATLSGLSFSCFERCFSRRHFTGRTGGQNFPPDRAGLGTVEAKLHEWRILVVALDLSTSWMMATANFG